MKPLTSALVILNGEPPSKDLLSERWGKHKLKICADGAAEFLYKENFIPDYVIGDLDSISSKLKKEISGKNLIYLSDQNTTDGEKIINFCVDHKIDTIEILGALGKRFDHSLYNIELLKFCLEKKIKAKFLSDLDEIFLINSSISIDGKVGERISFFSVFGETKCVQTQGLKYQVSNQTMQLGLFSSASNEFSSMKATIKIGRGFLLIVREKSID